MPADGKMTKDLSVSEIRSSAAIPKATSGYVEVNGTSLYYEDTGGSGDPIIFSHALLLNLELFRPQINFLKQHYRCIAYEHRGQGRSAEVAHFSVSMDVLCDDVVALIKTLNLGKVHFCGLSMGGFVGLRLAARHPHLIKSLIISSSSADAEPFSAMMKYALLNSLSALFGPASVASAVAPIIYGRTTRNDPTRQSEYLALIDQVGNNRRSIWRAVNGVIYRPGISEELKKINAPTLVLVGDEDTCQVPAKSERLAQCIAGARFERIPSAGHAITLEQPRLVNDVILKFLAAVAGDEPQDWSNSR